MERGLGRRVAVALLVVLGLLLLAGSTSMPGRALAAFPGANGKIAFESLRDGADGNFHDNLYTMNADGSAQANLTRDRFHLDLVDPPAWSPDGNRIAFAGTVAGFGGSFGIIVMDADGSNARQVASVCADSLVWSPNGRTIAFAGCAGDQPDIYVVNSDSSGLNRLTSSGGYDPEWSPDGRKLLFTCKSGICVMNADGSAQTNLTKNLHDIGFFLSPHWSPDGRTIAFVAYDKSGGLALDVMNADGSDLRELAPDPTEPAWSPDGMKIAFESGSGSACCAIFAVNADGSDLTRLTSGRFFGHPEWSPDGRKILFTAYHEIYVMNADGSDQTNLTLTDPEKPPDDFPSWQTVPSADLALSSTARTSTVRRGRRLTYTITLHNAGPSNAMAVVVSDRLPTQTGFLTIHASEGKCSHPPRHSTGTVACSLGLQLTGTSWSARIVVETGVKRTIRNTIRVTSSTPDPNPANNAATIRATVGVR